MPPLARRRPNASATRCTAWRAACVACAGRGQSLLQHNLHINMQMRPRVRRRVRRAQAWRRLEGFGGRATRAATILGLGVRLCRHSLWARATATRSLESLCDAASAWPQQRLPGPCRRCDGAMMARCPFPGCQSARAAPGNKRQEAGRRLARILACCCHLAATVRASAIHQGGGARRSSLPRRFPRERLRGLRITWGSVAPQWRHTSATRDRPRPGRGGSPRQPKAGRRRPKGNRAAPEVLPPLSATAARL